MKLVPRMLKPPPLTLDMIRDADLGVELDRLVERYVMGDRSTLMKSAPPRYSTEIAIAQLVWRQMKSKGYRSTAVETTSLWRWSFMAAELSRTAGCEHATVSEASCRAALMAVLYAPPGVF